MPSQFNDLATDGQIVAALPITKVITNPYAQLDNNLGIANLGVGSLGIASLSSGFNASHFARCGIRNGINGHKGKRVTMTMSMTNGSSI